MKTGLDYRPALLSRTGVGRYTREITAAMAPLLGDGDELSLFSVSLAAGSRAASAGSASPDSGRVRLVRGRFPARLLHLLGRTGLLGVESFTGPLDLFLYTDFVYPPLRSTRHAVTVYDLAFLRSDRFHRKGFARVVWRRMKPVIESAAAVLAPSPATADDVRRFAPGCADRVHLVPLGGDHLSRPGAESAPQAGAASRAEAGFRADAAPRAEAALLRARNGREGPFFLAVGTLEPRKNWEGVLRAFEQAAPGPGGADLLFAGTKGWLCDDFVRRLETSALRERVRFIDAPGDELLALLYDRALALVYPSFWEGFGLPVAEALSAGCPVITSDRASLPWLAGDAALVVDPEETASLAGAMRRILGEAGLRKELAAAARERAPAFTWTKTAAATLEVLRHEASR